MNDLIHRQDVLHELDGCDYELKDWQRWKLKTMVRDIPSAEPERKKGRIKNMLVKTFLSKCSPKMKVTIWKSDAQPGNNKKVGEAGELALEYHFNYCSIVEDFIISETEIILFTKIAKEV